MDQNNRGKNRRPNPGTVIVSRVSGRSVDELVSGLTEQQDRCEHPFGEGDDDE